METIHTTHSLIHENIKIAKAFQKHYHHRNKQPPPAFAINDKGMLAIADLLIRGQICPKLKHRFFGAFTVIECINPQVYRLELPYEMECHPGFHVSILRPWDTDTCTSHIPDPLVGRAISSPASPIIDKIVDCKIGPYQRLYQHGPTLLLKVQYIGLPRTADEWIPYGLLMHSPSFIHFA
jgi:hypothetical protein